LVGRSGLGISDTGDVSRQGSVVGVGLCHCVAVCTDTSGFSEYGWAWKHRTVSRATVGVLATISATFS